MQAVSQQWKDNHRQTLVNEGFLEVSFDIADPDAIVDASATDNGAIYIADTDSTVNNQDKSFNRYATLEQNIWMLDGSAKFIPGSDYGDTGYVSLYLSGNDCLFGVVPEVSVEFSEVHTRQIPGVTITWSSAYNEFATQFEIFVYSGGVLKTSKAVYDNASVQSVVLFDIEEYDQINVRVYKWCLPKRRARIERIFAGINKIFSKSNITQYKHTQNAHPLSLELPKNEIQISIDNSDNTYNPNNPSGLSEYLMTQQRMKARYGYRIGDSTEWIDGGVFYLSDWDAPQSGIEANFTARDLLGFMSETYYEGIYNPSGETLYNLAAAIMQKANLPLLENGDVGWEISTTLQSITTKAPIPICTLAEALQYIANAGGCVLYQDRVGKLQMQPLSATVQDYKISLFNSYQQPDIVLSKPLRKVDVSVYQYFDGDAGQDLFSGTVYVDGTEDVIVTYSSPAKSVSASIVGGTINSAEYYTNACKLNITATGDTTITVTGTTLKSSENILTISYSQDGETIPVQNPLITDATVAASVGNSAVTYFSNRKTLSHSWRADPRVDALDIIKSENAYGENNVRLASVSFAYNGAFKGEGEGRTV